MSKFIARGFAKLSTREQVLIFALLVLCLPLAIGYFAILPLQDRLRSAERNAIEHSATLNWVAERVEEFPLNARTIRMNSRTCQLWIVNRRSGPTVAAVPVRSSFFNVVPQ